ncbi:MAG: hypothetical protein Q9228_008079, partial [Teloschistes exilis]
MRVEMDITYNDLGLAQPEGGAEEVGSLMFEGSWMLNERKMPMPDDVSKIQLIDRQTGEIFTFKTREELSHFKYQRYMKRYLRTIHEHGWFDKRFIYEESFQMPFLISGPGIKPESTCDDIISNVDFAPTWLEVAGLRIPNYMQGDSFLASLRGTAKQSEDGVAYHRYWMHAEKIHNAYAHYGIRDKRYKLIFWYNEGYGLPGASAGGEEQEWELFDCKKDPMELFN